MGKGGISKDATTLVVVDWRAPVANAYYENGLGKCSYSSPDGSQIHITGLSNMVVTYYEMNVEADGSWIEEVRYHHGLVLDYEVISSRQDPSWIGVQLSVEVSYVNKAGETVTGTYGTVMTREGNQVVLQLAEVTEYLEPEATLRVINCEYLLDEVYELPITIK